MYGTASEGGLGYGTIWKITPSGIFSVLYEFKGTTDGWNPLGDVTIDKNGNLFGTTEYTGAGVFDGTVWELDHSGTFKTLHRFSGGSDGRVVYCDVVFDANGNMFGTAGFGGDNSLGVVWEIDTSGSFSVVHTFTGGSDGAYPLGSVTFDSRGNMYGTANDLGDGGSGTVWKIDPSGNFSTLYSFTNNLDGAYPSGMVTIGANGDLYGTTSSGNIPGTVWKIDTSGNFSVLHGFTGGTDGSYPQKDATIAPNGNLYGTTGVGGRFNNGTIWTIDPSGNFSVVYTFKDLSDGGGPQGDVTFDSLGNLYGTAYSGGGSYPVGTVWKITTSNLAPEYISTSPNAVVGGTSSIGTVVLTANAPGGVTVSLASSDANAQVPATVTIPAGSNSATFTITTSPVYSKDTVTLSATCNGKTVSSTLAIAITDALHYIAVSPGSLVAGGSTTGTVTLNSPAPTDVYVSLISSNGAAQLPANVTIPSGALSATFNITTLPVYVVTSINISAVLGPKTVNCGLLLGPTDSVHSISASPNSVTGGGSSTGTVFLTTPAPTGGTYVTLSSSSPDLQVTSPVFVPAGQVSETFSITTSGVFLTETVSINATIGNKTVSCGFGIGASAVLHAVTISPSSIIGGTTTTGTLSLNGPAPIGGATVTLSSSDPSAQVPSTVTVLAGQTSATFSITTSPVAANTNPQITATLNGISKSCGLIVAAPQLSSFHVSQTTVVAGNTATVTVTITGPAPVGGTTITLGSSSGYATLPSTIVIPEGATSATATLSTTPPGGITLFSISAALGGKTDTINMILQL